MAFMTTQKEGEIKRIWVQRMHPPLFAFILCATVRR
jgi:hypothetical protein